MISYNITSCRNNVVGGNITATHVACGTDRAHSVDVSTSDIGHSRYCLSCHRGHGCDITACDIGSDIQGTYNIAAQTQCCSIDIAASDVACGCDLTSGDHVSAHNISTCCYYATGHNVATSDVGNSSHGTTTDTTSDLKITTSQQSCYYCTRCKYIATSDVARCTHTGCADSSGSDNIATSDVANSRYLCIGEHTACGSDYTAGNYIATHNIACGIYTHCADSCQRNNITAFNIANSHNVAAG